MASTTLITLFNELTDFCAAHKGIERFEFEYEEQLPNLATEDKIFPFVFAAPIDFTTDGSSNKHTIRIYAYNRLLRDRENVLYSTNDTSLLITDIVKWWNGYNFNSEIELVNEPVAVALNNSQLDYLQGYVAEFEFTIPTYSRCDIPLSGTPTPILPECVDAFVLLNGESVTGVPSGGQKDINLVDTLGDPFTDFNKTVDTASALEIEITNNRIGLQGAPMKTNASPSVAFNDDADFQRGAGDDAWNLSWENPLYGGKQRFRGLRGGYQVTAYDGTGGDYMTKDGVVTDESTAIPNNIIIDWSTLNEIEETVTGFIFSRKADSPIDSTLKTVIEWCNESPYTTGGYGQWYVVNFSEFVSIMNQSLLYPTLHAPFNYSPFNQGTKLIFSTPRNTTVSTQFWGILNFNFFPTYSASDDFATMLRRTFTITELRGLI